jgi:hypothetical protein
MWRILVLLRPKTHKAWGSATDLGLVRDDGQLVKQRVVASISPGPIHARSRKAHFRRRFANAESLTEVWSAIRLIGG